TRVGLEAPDAAISWIPFLVGENFQLAKTSGITAIMNILRSESTGSIHVLSSRPDTPPVIRFNFLSASLDREVTLELGGKGPERESLGRPEAEDGQQVQRERPADIGF